MLLRDRCTIVNVEESEIALDKTQFDLFDD